MSRRLLAAAMATAATALGIAASAASAAEPTFKNGLAQAVFSTDPADWYSGEVWVRAPFDSDGDCASMPLWRVCCFRSDARSLIDHRFIVPSRSERK